VREAQRRGKRTLTGVLGDLADPLPPPLGGPHLVRPAHQPLAIFRAFFRAPNLVTYFTPSAGALIPAGAYPSFVFSAERKIFSPDGVAFSMMHPQTHGPRLLREPKSSVCFC